MMTLAEYLSWKKISCEDFAAKIDVSRTAVIRYRDGDRRPSWKVMPKIVKATGGKVTADSFLSRSAA